MKVKIRKENCVIAKYIYEGGKLYEGPIIGAQTIEHGISGYALSAIILALIPIK